ncbi:MAG: hypothetical protein K8T90_20380 [Planctomycetes bacterium]|nr:hypothetical protein [Planctomycetota bacterium]
MSDAPPPPPRSAPDVSPPRRDGDRLDDLPPKKQRLSTGRMVLIACAVLCFLCVVIGTVAVVVPRGPPKRERLVCATNLSQLAQMFVIWQTQGAKPPRSGPAMFLAWRKDRTRIREGEESVLRCPNDPGAADAAKPEARALYDSIDLDHPAPGLCSYAVRDFVKFPLDPMSKRLQAIAACLHHRNGAVVAFDNGSAMFMELDALGATPGTELTVGPDSPAEVLQPLTFGDGRTR